MADVLAGNEFLRMQNEAMSRVRQMQQRADSFAQQTPFNTPHLDGASVQRNNQVQASPSLPAKASPNGHPTSPRSLQSQGKEQPLSSLLGMGKGLLGSILGEGNPISGLLGSLFGGESDKLLIMGMIYLLSKESGDQMLIMALFYILMD